MAKVKIEGNTLDLPDDVCKTNKGLTDALLPFYPAAANADIKRETKGEETVITVTKKAGTKGHSDPVIAALDAAAETINPVLLIDTAKVKKLPAAELDAALEQFLEEERQVLRIVKALDNAEPQSAAIPPVGF
jgi:hypothetical protein